MSEVLRDSIPRVGVQYRVKRHSSERTVYNGNQSREMAVATFDPSANTAQRPIAAYGLSVYIPDNAVITNVFYDVVTTFTSAGADAGTIALSIQAADDLVAAIAISDASNVYDAGMHGTLTAGTTTLSEAGPNTRTQIVNAADIAAGYIKMTAEREITATVAVQALTAGKLNIYIEYFISN